MIDSIEEKLFERSYFASNETWSQVLLFKTIVDYRNYLIFSDWESPILSNGDGARGLNWYVRLKQTICEDKQQRFF